MTHAKKAALLPEHRLENPNVTPPENNNFDHETQRLREAAIEWREQRDKRTPAPAAPDNGMDPFELSSRLECGKANLRRIMCLCADCLGALEYGDFGAAAALWQDTRLFGKDHGAAMRPIYSAYRSEGEAQ